MKSHSIVSLAAAALMSLSASVAAAQMADPKSAVIGYVIDARNAVATSGTNLCWRTGYWSPAMAIAECDPDLISKPATPAATPAAQVAPAKPVAAKPAAEKMTLSADALFDYDKATLRPEGEAKLDELAQKANGMKLEVIIAVGHADRIGSNRYNQALSERRAAAVREHLMASGIEANRIYTEGKGETQPVTGEQCKNMGPDHRSSKKLVACLQPDRRVEIEVIGTK